MNISDAVSDYLPTKSQKLIWGMTAALTPASMFLYEGLDKLGLQLEPLRGIQVRVLLGLGVFSLGMASLNLLLMLYIRNNPTSKAAAPSGRFAAMPPPLISAKKAQPEPEPDSLTVLARLAHDNRQTPAEIAKLTGFSLPTTKYHLDELERMRLINSNLNMYPEVLWYIEPKGRACLKRHNLLP